MSRIFFALGALFGAIGVSLGAYGAHGGARLIELHQAVITYGKASRYNMYHAFALLAVAWALDRWPEQKKWLTPAGWLQVAGIVMFSGSLYAQSLTGIHFGYITPAGGISFVAGWLLMAWAAWNSR
ncbi:MAG TPA: DUF423 domain-containing protein [Calditrichaeota bacterium]|nr:DUF423 domain-containing protein [Calditrichota bacterium]